MKKQGIYKILNCVDNKCYIGSSLNLDKRLVEHKRLLNLNMHDNYRLQQAWNNLGEDKFKFEIIEIVETLDNYEDNNSNLRQIETNYIQKFNSYNSDFGYNIIPGGIGTIGVKCSEEKRKKISEANTGRIAYNLGQKMSEEQKELLRKKDSELYGKAIDIYTINKVFIETLPSIREVHRKYGSARNTIKDCCENRCIPKNLIFRYHGDTLDTIGVNKPMKSEEELKKQAESYRKNHGKAVDIYDVSGKFIETLPAIVAVHEKYGISETTIRSGLKTKKLAGGKFYRYAGEELGDITESLKKLKGNKANSNSPFFYNVYKNDINKTFIESCKYKKDVEKYAKPREKSKLNKLLSEYSNYLDNFIYHEYYIEYNFAPNISNDISESRQLNDKVEGIKNDANGEA